MKKSELKELDKELENFYIHLRCVCDEYKIKNVGNTSYFVNAVLDNLDYARQEVQREIKRLKKVEEANKLNWLHN